MWNNPLCPPDIQEGDTAHKTHTLISNVKKSHRHNACRIQQHRSRTPLIPLVIKPSSLSCNDGQRSLVKEERDRERETNSRRGPGKTEKDTHFLQTFYGGGLKIEATVNFLINLDDSGGV